MKEITQFKGKYYFLSTSANCEIYDDYAKVTYPTLAHAFEACKTFSIEQRHKIARESSAGNAKRASGKNGYVTIRDDWENVQDSIMLELLRIKYRANAEYRQRLKETYPAKLIDAGLWADPHWGVTSQGGKNRLGVLSMRVRDEILREDGEL